MRDDLAARLLATFLEELDDQAGVMLGELRALESDPTDEERLKALFRVLHTLKGAARVAGVPSIEQACHALETDLVDVREGREELDAARIHLLYAAADALADTGRRIRSGQELHYAPISVLIRQLTGAELPEMSASGAGGAAESMDSAPSTPTSPASRSEAATATPERWRAAARDASSAEATEGPIRVQAEELDALLASTGDLLITTGRVGERPATLEALHERLNGLAAEWHRSGPKLLLLLERAEAPAALTALVRRLDDELRSTARDTARLARDAAGDARSLGRISDEVAESVSRMRLRPFADACQALPSAVRDVAEVTGRSVAFELRGQEVRVDRAIVDALREPLLQLVRNAVDHGIELPAQRVRVGKPERGTVRVEASLVGGRLSVRVSDDGAGLDIDAVRARLEERGLEVARDEREIIRALFAGGLSTRRQATEISGRGVGLNVVRATLERIGGSVDVHWTAGQGTTFVLECPPTPARIRALLVGAGSYIFAIPTSHVERLRRIEAGEIRSTEGRPVLAGGDEPIAFGSLAAILGPPLATRPIRGKVPVVVLQAGENRLAVAVEELIAEQELVFRPLERGRISLPHISGGALLPTGQAALVVNPGGVIAAGLAQGGPVEVAEEATDTGAPVRRRILVVDDSITTRTLEQSILEAAGYDVLTAVDGEAAWQVLQEETVDLVVADVEMPRLDGFGLCEAIRASKRLRDVPVVLVTALESAEGRARGLEAGADAYLAKSSFDQDTLLDTIRQLLE